MTFLMLQRYKLKFQKKKYICSDSRYMYQYTLQCPNYVLAIARRL